MWNTQECLSYSRAVAFLVFFPRATRTRLVAPNFRARTDGLRSFRLRRPRLILQIFLLTLLAAFDFARDGRQMLRLARTCRCASDSGSGALRRRAPRLLLRLSPPPALLALLHFHVGEITKQFIVDSRPSVLVDWL